MSKKYRNNHHQTLAAKIPAWGILAPILAVFLLFMAVRLNTPFAGKWTAILCMLAALGAGILNFSTLRERFRLPTIVLSLFVLMNGISTLYADAGKFALREFLKLLVGFCIVLIFLSLAKGKEAKPGRTIAAVLARCAAVSGLVSIDHISTRIISTPVLNFLKIFTPEYTDLEFLMEGTRLNAISGNANIFAGYVGLGVLLSLGLALSSESSKERAGHVVCLFINSLSFVLAFSMGASGVIAVAFLVYLLLERKETRGGLLVLMVETLAVTLMAAGLISATSFTAWAGSIRPIPLLCVVVGSVALCLSDGFIGQKLEKQLANHGKFTMALIAIVLVVVLMFALLAFTWTTGIELGANEWFYRTIYPAPGTYSLKVQADGDVWVRLESQDRLGNMMGIREELYSGAENQITFTVPEGSEVLYVIFSSSDGALLESAHYEGANGEGNVPLQYKLLPSFIANRLQGLFANQNFIQRTVFFEDGLKLFKKAPVFGLGIGAYESTLMSVQEFHYETKYAHNHYIQTLAETGLVGFILFVALFVVGGIAVFKARRKEDMHPLVPALGAALFFMAGHAAVEVTFSAFDFIPIAFGVFALIEVCCGDAIPSPWMTKKVQTGGLVGTALLVAVFFGMLCSTMMARFIVEEQASYSNLARAAKMDKYEWADYALSYVIGAQRESDPELRAKADELAVELSKIESNTIHIYLAEYYFFTDQVDLAFDRVEDHVTFVASDSETWETAFALLENHEIDTPAYRERALRIYQMMQEWDEANIGTITISQQAMDFITRIGG